MTHEVFFMPNGTTAAFKDGQQVPELQISWLLMYAKFMEQQGVDPLQVRFNLPGGPAVTLFSIGDGEYNWQIENPR